MRERIFYSKRCGFGALHKAWEDGPLLLVAAWLTRDGEMWDMDPLEGPHQIIEEFDLVPAANDAG